MIVASSPWLMIILSSAAELGGTMALKYSHGFSKLTPSLLTIFFYTAAIYLMSIAAKSIDISTVYAVWASGSAVLVCLGGNILFAESLTTYKILGILFSMSGIFLLNKGGNIE
ncbi:multidrug efflux SMR transporter [Pseudomonas sp. LP_7_YM]|uniref:DMT family transporter n=1 Tax=Pseudomonas sp. LP_7_YM TaxID=2485137 RepID=UPI0010F20E50|nr:multidrug efflux SMR transporter [Pseudomonas sp. LP_7_YM]TDV59264.1 small multidrug resistance pump [Pseudomonas sp. LP_7_YM]